MAQHWVVREWRKICDACKDPVTWVMVAVLLMAVALMLRFLFNAADNFGTYYSMPYACSERFSQLRLFFLSMLAPLFFVSVFVTMGEITVVLGMRKKKRKANHKFLYLSLFAMVLLGVLSFGLLSC